MILYSVIATDKKRKAKSVKSYGFEPPSMENLLQILESILNLQDLWMKIWIDDC